MSFGSGIEAYAKKTKLSIDQAVVAVNSELVKNVILKTPIDKGRLVANWIPSFGAASSTATLETTSKSDKQSEVQGEALNSAGKVFFLTNNLVYAKAIEYGHSKVKSPQGMLRVSIQEIQSALRKFKTVK